MRVLAVSEKSLKQEYIEVEVALGRGLPQVKVLGLPDAQLKESSKKLKQALQKQGFKWPKFQEILVNLKPSHKKKDGRGLELAIVVQFLLQTGQLKWEKKFEQLVVMGEFNLFGEVEELHDAPFLENLPNTMVITGPSKKKYACHLILQKLSDLMEEPEPLFPSLAEASVPPLRPPLDDIRFPKDLAEIVMVAAAGEHSVLLAGPAGSGKTTALTALHQLLRDPDGETWNTIQKISRATGEPNSWRPYRNPHHSTTTLALTGGGVPVKFGEITKSHGGVLHLDELLEFDARTVESLREPLDRGEILLSRGGESLVAPARFLLVSSTNLCPCGKWTSDDLAPTRCRYPLIRCRSYLQKLSGPLLDRFHLLFMTKTQGKESEIERVEIFEMKRKVDRAIEFALVNRAQSLPNSMIPGEEIDKTLAENLMMVAGPAAPMSQRRKKSLLQVARTLADLDLSEKVELDHLVKAQKLAVRPFAQMDE